MRVYYHADLDGECSAAIYLDAARRQFTGEIVTCRPIDYKDDFPFEAIRPGEPIALLDFSLQKPGDWAKLLALGSHVIWIDHHKTALEHAAAITLPDLDGLRSTEAAGCELTWKYFWPRTPTPYGVDLIGDYDTWTFKHGEDTRKFQAYLMTMADTRPTSDLWPLMLEGEGGNFSYINTLEMGRQVLEKRVISAAEDVAAWSWTVEFCGYAGIALNGRPRPSWYFESVAEDYELLLPCVYDGEQWTVSIYRGGAAGAETIDCAALAQQFGGGGHPGASGFQCRTLPWEDTTQ